MYKLSSTYLAKCTTPTRVLLHPSYEFIASRRAPLYSALLLFRVETTRHYRADHFSRRRDKSRPIEFFLFFLSRTRLKKAGSFNRKRGFEMNKRSVDPAGQR